MIVRKLHPTARDRELVNAREIGEKAQPEQYDFRDLIVPKPWGEEYLLYENEDAAVWVLKINPGMGTSLHAHLHKTTSLIVLSGRAVCETLSDTFSLSVTQAVLLGKGVFHKSHNEGNENLFLLEIESPVNKYDLLRYKDNYGRHGKGYEDKSNYQECEGLFVGCGERAFDGARVAIRNVSNKEQLLKDVTSHNTAVITILDRNVWAADGTILVEVGKSFKLQELGEEFEINDTFTYLVIYSE